MEQKREFPSLDTHFETENEKTYSEKIMALRLIIPPLLGNANASAPVIQ